MIYKFVSIKNVVEKIYRDFDHQEELDIADVIEWFGEALQKIGVGIQDVEKESIIKVENHCAILPCDFHDFGQGMVSYNGEPMQWYIGKYGPIYADSEQSDTEGTTRSEKVNEGDNRWNSLAVDPDTFPTNANIKSRTFRRIPETFYIDNSRLITCVKEGDVHIVYRALRLDSEGYPMIPDVESYRSALSSYAQMMMDRRLWRSGKIPDKVFAETKRDWEKFCREARGDGLMPNLSKMEAIKRMWVRLKPNMNSYKTAFNDLGLESTQKNKN